MTELDSQLMYAIRNNHVPIAKENGHLEAVDYLKSLNTIEENDRNS